MATEPEGGIAFDVVTYLTGSLAEERGWYIPDRGVSVTDGVLDFHLTCVDATPPGGRPRRPPVELGASNALDLLAKVIALDPTEAAAPGVGMPRPGQIVPPQVPSSQPVVLWPDGVYRLLRAEHLRDPHRDAVVAGVTIGWTPAVYGYSTHWTTGARLGAWAAILPLPGPEKADPADLAIELITWAVEGNDKRPAWVDPDYSFEGGV